ncbi:fused MFS/spermidine synthase [Euzebya tangerina]|uniref:fused MFS/spermidine synthase n=1 Tax=Euzebya tangerina TaxID=591198 RepID=UPI000E310BF5|nr:fused MFS/spermidine synthase [Euzebya tangerina]
MSQLAASCLVFFTSAAVLVFEILAGRLLAPYVGVTLETFTGIIGVVLAGIAVGTWYGGRLADNHDPRRLLGPMLVLGGALSIASLPIIRLFGGVGLGSGPLAIVFLSTVGFFLPAAVLSAVNPTVIKLQLADLDETGAVVGRLSAVSTFGALFGTFITGFLLVAALPTTPIIFGVGGVLVGWGVVVWYRLPRDLQTRAVVGAATVLALATGALGLAFPSPCQVESAYFCASVTVDPERSSGRLLTLDTLRHSYVDLEDPTHLEFTYAQALSDVLSTLGDPGEPLDVLHIGGGGFSLPMYLEATRPGTFSRVLELDPVMVELAEDDLGLVLSEDLQARTGDARLNILEEASGRYDLVIGDAFGGQAVPWHLTTRELVEEVERVLTDEGTYAINLIDYGPLGFARAEAATIRDVFEHVAVIAPPERIAGREGGNFVMVGSNAPIDVEAIQRRAEEREDDDIVVGDDAGLDEFIDGARVLTDDFAPVDQLLTPLS